MKKTVLTLLQIAVTIGILCWIFRDPEKRANTLHALRDSDKLWILAGIIAFGIVEILAAVRWQILLRVQGVTLGFFRVMCLVMIGILFNLFMPGGTGGDVIKIFYLLKETPGKKAEALLAVLMDRLIGLLGLIILTSIIMVLRYQWLSGTEVTRNLTWTLFAIMGGSLGGIIFSFLITGFGLAHKLPKKMPGRDKLIDISIAYNAYARAWKASLGALFISFGIHICSFYVFYAAARALRQTTPLLDFAGIMPVINTIASLPISVGGAGVREKLFEEMLSKLCGIQPAVADAISLTGFSVLVFWAIVGGVVYLFYRPTQHAKFSDIEHEVHELEHKVAESE
jgi:uncharacterized protein (TIRG00374 family)